MRKLLFWEKMMHSENVVSGCYRKDSIFALADKFHIGSMDVLNATVSISFGDIFLACYSTILSVCQ